MIDVGVGQVADDTVRDVLEGRMPQQVAAEQVARLDPVGLQEAGQLVAREAGVLADGDDEAEPGRLGVRRGAAAGSGGPRRAAARPCSRPKLAWRRGDEAVQLRQLRAADGRLHVGHLQVVADVAVDVLVVVAERQRAELLAEALAAGVVLAAGAVAVAAPVAERARDARQLRRRR